MNKKVSEILDDLEYEWLEDIELEEDERIDWISFENIKGRAMQGIEEIDEKIIHIDTIQKKKRNKKRIAKRVILPLVAAISLMGITAVAINSNENLKEILGEDLPFMQSEIQSIGETTTHKGITFTAEAAAIENKAGVFFLSFEKEDGSSFEEGTVFRRIQPNMEKKGGMGWVSNFTLTDDGKRLIALVDVSGSRDLYNQTIEFTGYDIGTWEEGEVEPKIDLEKAYQNTLANQEGKKPRAWEDYEQEESLGMSLIETFPDYRLDKVEFEGERLNIITSQFSPNGESLLDHVDIKLMDRRTGKEVEKDGGSGSWDREDERNKMCDRFVGVMESDLPYLDIVGDYRYFDPLVTGEWTVAFQLGKNQNVKEKKLFKKIKTEDINVTLHDVQISKLGVKIEGIRHRGSSYDLTGYVQMKDGSKIELLNSGSWGKWKLVFGKQYKFGGNIDNNKEEINANKKISHNREGETISDGFGVSTISVSTSKNTGDKLNLPNIIDLENVASIVLEGFVIPIR